MNYVVGLDQLFHKGGESIVDVMGAAYTSTPDSTHLAPEKIDCLNVKPALSYLSCNAPIPYGYGIS